MKRIFISGLALLSSATIASAAPAPVKQGDITEASGLTIAECLVLLAGHRGLDGRQELSKDGTPVTLPWKFENVKLRTAIQQNMAALLNVEQNADKVRQNLFREIAGEKVEIPAGSADHARYIQMVNDAQQLPCKAVLTRFSIGDLRLEKNEIPGSTTGNLDKILDK